MDICDRIYNVLASADMTLNEIAKALKEPYQNVSNAMITTTFRFPNLYGYYEKRGNKIVEVFGRVENYKEMRLKDIAKLIGITPSGLYSRLNRGMSLEEAVAMGGKNA